MFSRFEVISQVDLTAKLTATGAAPGLLPSQHRINFLRRFPHHVANGLARRALESLTFHSLFPLADFRDPRQHEVREAQCAPESRASAPLPAVERRKRL
jgi:hypothetical protein